MESNKPNEVTDQPRKYWVSLEHRDNDPEFMAQVEREFSRSPLSVLEGDLGGIARRDFLKIMGASIALSATGCIRRPVEKVVPYAVRPEDIIPGQANHYTSSWVTAGEGYGLLVKTREGRPILAEGHVSHALNQGAMTARAHAHLLALYDPDRLQGPQMNLHNPKRTNRDTVGLKWEELDKKVVAQLQKGSVAILTGSHGSPTAQRLIESFLKVTGGRHFQWDALSSEDVRQGQKDAYGSEVMPRYRFDRARFIVAIDADFLGTWLAPAYFSRAFANTRKPGAEMSRLVVFESNMTLTGANADARVRIKPSQQVAVVMGLAHELIVKQKRSAYAGDRQIVELLAPFAEVAKELSIESGLLSQIADDLWTHRGQGLVVAGGLPGASKASRALQVAVNFLNTILDNDGRTIDPSEAPFVSYRGSYAALNSLIEEMAAGRVQTLIIDAVNPMYASPLAERFRQALAKVGMVVYTGTHMDETAVVADVVATGQHPMESWGDAEIIKGLYTIQQPTIRPLYETRSFEDSLLTWGNGVKAESFVATNYYEYLRTSWQEHIFPNFARGRSFDAFWNQALQDGWVDGGKRDAVAPARSFRREALAMIKYQPQQGLELVLYPTVALGDGSLANVAWLQELPDPITKICWDSYASVSIAKAKELGLKEGDVVALKIGAGGVALELPVHVQPGVHDDVVAVPVGFGRTHAGRVANGVGANAYPLASFDQGFLVASGLGVSLEKTSRKVRLANVQEHNTLAGRDHEIIPSATLSQYLKNPAAGVKEHHIVTIWPEHEYKGHKWAMSIDLNVCTGCSSCTIACQAENNIPVVGKKYVREGRVMHWMRIDRYYSGNEDNPEVFFEPMLCQHCDNAPCETVCPVIATSHNTEGLNEMSYNRCVGTRYCANNCYYKVRRFNWFNYAKDFAHPLNLALNPDVTVRSRGVMEKCTFCVQRIKDGKNKAKLENRPVVDGEIRTACEASCPTGAIVFGDVNDPESRVSRRFAEKRNMKVLEEFNAQPNVRYQTKIRHSYNSAENNAHKEGSHS